MCCQVLPASVDFHMPLPRLPLNGVAGAGIHDIGIGGSDLDGADAIDARLLVEDGEPGDAGAGGFPDAAQRRAEVERAGVADGAGDGGDSSAMERPHVSPLEARIEIGIDLRRVVKADASMPEKAKRTVLPATFAS